MSNYRRLLVKGGTYFFTVVTYKRQRLFTCVHIGSRKIYFRGITCAIIMGNCYIAGVFGTDVQRTKECRARRYRSFARPTSEYF